VQQLFSSIFISPSSFSLYFFRVLVIVLCCTHGCAIDIYVYFGKGLIHHPKSIQERPIDIVVSERVKFFALHYSIHQKIFIIV